MAVTVAPCFSASDCYAESPLVYIDSETSERFVYVLPNQTNDPLGQGEGLIDDSSAIGGTNSGSVRVLAGSTRPPRFWFSSELLFGREITLKEISNFEFVTKKSTVQGSLDWYANLYTRPTEGQIPAGWFNARLTGEPYFSAHLNAPAGQWNTWSTGGAVNKLHFFDQTSGGSYTKPHWETTLDLLSSRSPSVKHGNSELMFFFLSIPGIPGIRVQTVSWIMCVSL